MAALNCRVCGSDATGVLLVDRDGKAYHRCTGCQATFLEPSRFPTSEAEYAHYVTHENDVGDVGYRTYLSKLADPLLSRLRPASSGLDYGCGPAAALADMMRNAGHDMSLYDPYFEADRSPLARTYDFVTCTETAEHFQQPIVEFKRLSGLLKPGGLLAVMTIFQTDDARFENWRYRHDPTHVVFYREQTFAVLAQQLSMGCEIIARDVVFLTKPH
ncbi:class I SAM-dependent methyltransferase [Anderseniella sp. Alg231-50]|uniref:class I SAM-dependent methyltransferase n=1 Tax=Anderseniella sp. Alg231-50 TaxID=1922226 RepID=UPI00307BD867